MLWLNSGPPCSDGSARQTIVKVNFTAATFRPLAASLLFHLHLKWKINWKLPSVWPVGALRLYSDTSPRAATTLISVGINEMRWSKESSRGHWIIRHPPEYLPHMWENHPWWAPHLFFILFIFDPWNLWNYHYISIQNILHKLPKVFFLVYYYYHCKSTHIILKKRTIPPPSVLPVFWRHKYNWQTTAPPPLKCHRTNKARERWKKKNVKKCCLAFHNIYRQDQEISPHLLSLIAVWLTD